MKNLLKICGLAKAINKPRIYNFTSSNFHYFSKPTHNFLNNNLFYTNLYTCKKFSQNNKDNNSNNDKNNKDVDKDKTKDEKGTKKVNETPVVSESAIKKIEDHIEKEKQYKNRDKSLTFSESITLERKEDSDGKEIIADKSDKKDDTSTSEQEKLLKGVDAESTEDQKSKIDFHPLIFYQHPILPYSIITINNPNRNEVFLGLALKYGKLTAVDEETTNIEDITVFFEKEDPLKKKEISPNFLLGTECKLSYNKQRLIIEGTEKINRIKSVRQGKYKSYKSKDAVELSLEYSIDEAYSKDCAAVLENILSLHENIIAQIDFKENQFSDMDMKFPFELKDIRENLNTLLTTINNPDRIVIEDLKSNNGDMNKTEESKGHQENKVNEVYIENGVNLENAENAHISIENAATEKFLSELAKHSYYLTLKLNTFANNVYGLTNDFIKILHITDLKERLEKILENYSNIASLLNLKYNEYDFPKNFKLNFNNPFINESEADKLRIQKYKDSIEYKMSKLTLLILIYYFITLLIHSIINLNYRGP